MRRLGLISGCLLLAGCNALPALLGLGGSFVDSQIADFQTRTFAQPMQLVRPALVSALLELGVEVEAVDGAGPEQDILARSATRTVRVSLEPVASQATWVRVIAHDGADVDGATARWVLRRTAETLG